VYNRGHSDGYYLGREQGWSNAYGSKATHQKVLLGQVTHYYSQIGVAEITAAGNLKLGDEFVIIGETSGVVEGTIESLRLDEGEVESVKDDDVFAIKVSQRVRRNDKFFIMAPVAAKTA
jgi:putative protease